MRHYLVKRSDGSIAALFTESRAAQNFIFARAMEWPLQIWILDLDAQSGAAIGERLFLDISCNPSIVETR